MRGGAMSDSWFDKAKEAAKGAAQKAAEGAKNLAETAKNTNYSELLDKTKSMAAYAAEEARGAANNLMHKDQTNPVSDTDDMDFAGLSDEQKLQACNARLAKAEQMLQEVKDELARMQQKAQSTSETQIPPSVE